MNMKSIKNIICGEVFTVKGSSLKKSEEEDTSV